MTPPAVQANPALPWAAREGGTITLSEPVTGTDLANGALIITDSNGNVLEPQLNDGYVDYYLSDHQVGSIQIGEDEERTELTISNWEVGIESIVLSQ